MEYQHKEFAVPFRFIGPALSTLKDLFKDEPPLFGQPLDEPPLLELPLEDPLLPFDEPPFEDPLLPFDEPPFEPPYDHPAATVPGEGGEPERSDAEASAGANDHGHNHAG